MSPRKYQLGERQAAVDQTRARILRGTRELLMTEGGFAHFTMEGIAKQTGVARMTVYYQFGSKAKLLEALFDDLARRGELRERLGAAFSSDDPRDVLAGFVRAFAHFWASDRAVMRRLHALSVLDPVFAAVSRQERRREGAAAVIERLRGQLGTPGDVDDAVRLLHTLTGFEVYDGLAAAGTSFESVSAQILALANAALGVSIAR
jgi:AcrR family transcriptional regulator